MWKWLKQLLNPQAQPEAVAVRKRTPLETVSAQIAELEAVIKREEQALNAKRDLVIVELTNFFSSWFPLGAAEQAKGESEVTVTIARDLPRLKQEVALLASRVGEIVEREFGRDTNIWLNGSSYYYSGSNQTGSESARSFHPTFGPAIGRIEDELWDLLKAFGYLANDYTRSAIKVFYHPQQLSPRVFQLMVEYDDRSNELYRTRERLSKVLTYKVRLEAEILVATHLR